MGQKLGQHFLQGRAYLEKIAAAVTPAKVVIEIGAGQGALTEYLLEKAGRVIAIEIDPELVTKLMVRFAGHPKLRIVPADVLSTDLTQWGPATLAGNLPYYITSPVIERALAMGPLLEKAVFLMQKEVADRLLAKPGSRDYGFLTVATQLFADPKLVTKVPPGAFSPPPKVDSAAVLLTPRHPINPSDPAPLLAFVGLCFRQKRKTLRNNLAPFFGNDLVDALPEGSKRAEQLTLEQFRDLYSRLLNTGGR